MSAWLNSFLERPRITAPWLENDSSLYCIIDRARQPRALEYLHQQDAVTKTERLFQGTPFTALDDVSPIWVPVKAGTVLSSTAAKLCSGNRSGILLSSNAKPETAFQHAQQLLRMNVKAQGEVLARFYDPAFWNALALTVSPQALYGPWRKVYVPPASPADDQWRTWSRPEDDSEAKPAATYPLLLDDTTFDASDDVRWWYWVRARASESAGELLDAQLPLVFANLRLLVEHGINEGRHLERLFAQLHPDLLSGNPDVMRVLTSGMPAFEKVQQLEV
jgi:hypothetical protein